MKILLFLLALSFSLSASDIAASVYSDSNIHSIQQSKPRKPSKKKTTKSTKPQAKVKSSKGKPHKDPAYR